MPRGVRAGFVIGAVVFAALILTALVLLVGDYDLPLALAIFVIAQLWLIGLQLWVRARLGQQPSDGQPLD
jgi:hypothetical protein